LERDIFPTLGAGQISTISAGEILAVLNEVEARPAIETAHRLRQRCSSVFMFGIASGLCQSDPAAVIRKALSPVVRGHQPALINIDQVRDVLAQSSQTPAHPITHLALRFIALTAVRPGELRSASWDQFHGLDTDEPTWRIPAEIMKMKRPHEVPLSRQAAEVLAVAKTISEHFPYVFPNARFPRRPMSENALGYLMNRAGFHGSHTAHGWRAAFSSIMNERCPPDRAIIDLMLAHVQRDSVEAAYNRALHLQRRREIAQGWADLILEDAPPATAIISGPRRRTTVGFH
jgi:integrase